MIDDDDGDDDDDDDDDDDGDDDDVDDVSGMSTRVSAGLFCVRMFEFFLTILGLNQECSQRIPNGSSEHVCFLCVCARYHKEGRSLVIQKCSYRRHEKTFHHR